MNNSKLLGVISGFTRSEWTAFGHYLNGPEAAFNSRLRYFYDQLDHYYDEKFTPLIASKQLSEQLFDRMGLDSEKCRYLLADMWTACMNFLIGRNAVTDPVSGNLVLIRTLSSAPDSKAYRYHYNKMVRKRKETGDSNFFLNQFLSESAHLEEVVSESGRGDENNIGEVVRYLDLFYLSRKLQLMCEQQNLKNILGNNFSGELNDEVLSHVQTGVYADEPVIEIYFSVYRTLLDSEETAHFERLQELLQGHAHLFGQRELRDLYQHLMNYCIRKINTGHDDWVRILFDIYKKTLDDRIIYMEDHLSPWDFKNIVVIGLRSGEKAWVYDFINNRYRDISKKERDNALSYNLGYWNYYSGEYRKAISLISKVEFTDPYYQLDSRSILLKSYYETDDIDGLLYFIPSFRIFLARNRSISEYQRTIYKNLVRYTNKLVRSGDDPKKLELLFREVEKAGNVADINWLKSKIKNSLELHGH